MKVATVAACLFFLVAAACGDTADVTPTSTSPVTSSPVRTGTESLAGTSWVAQRILAGGVAQVLAAGSEPTAEFGADGVTISGSTGCNLYSGRAAIGEGTISVTEMAVTERACVAREVMDQEALFLDALTGIDSFTLAGRVLELDGPQHSVSFVEPPPVEDAMLGGTAWSLDTLIDGDAATSVVNNMPASLTLDVATASISGTTGCNGFGGAFKVNGTGLAITDMNWTEIACEPDVMRQEAFVLEILQNAGSYRIAGDRLTIVGSQGQSLVYRVAK